MKPSNKTKILLSIGITLTLVVSGAYTFFFVVMKNKTDATAKLFTQSQELSGKEVRIAAALLALKNEDIGIKKLSAYFIKENDIVGFTKKIEELGPKSNTTLEIRSLDPGIDEAKESILNFRVVGTGKFEDVSRLLVLLENFPAKFAWKTVRLVRESDTVPQKGEISSKVKMPEWRMEAYLTVLNFVKE